MKDLQFSSSIAEAMPFALQTAEQMLHERQMGRDRIARLAASAENADLEPISFEDFKKVLHEIHSELCVMPEYACSFEQMNYRVVAHFHFVIPHGYNEEARLLRAKFDRVKQFLQENYALQAEVLFPRRPAKRIQLSVQNIIPFRHDELGPDDGGGGTPMRLAA